MQARSHKLGIVDDNDSLYHVLDNRLPGLIYFFLISSFYLSIQINVKFFVKVFSGTKLLSISPYRSMLNFSSKFSQELSAL